ncbi:MAG: universal stress protein [Proteobacteria bacterium]|nr:universal stress protein [Pseudomonadota bacterium]
MFKRIMVCYDGSEHAKEALETTLVQFKGAKPEIIVVTVVEPPLDATGFEEKDFREWSTKRDEDLRSAAERVLDFDLDADAILAVGDPRKMIVETAEQKSPDLVVITRRGAGLLGKMALGNVSSYIISHINIPVLVL